MNILVFILTQLGSILFYLIFMEGSSWCQKAILRSLLLRPSLHPALRQAPPGCLYSHPVWEAARAVGRLSWFYVFVFTASIQEAYMKQDRLGF